MNKAEVEGEPDKHASHDEDRHELDEAGTKVRLGVVPVGHTRVEVRPGHFACKTCQVRWPCRIAASAAATARDRPASDPPDSSPDRPDTA